MSVVSGRTVAIAYTSGLTISQAFAAAANTNSPGAITLHTLASGANTITLPTGGTVVASATIIPPAANTQTLVLKGVTGDTGVQLHLTDPTVVAFATNAAATFCITAGGTVTGLRIAWA